MKNNYVMLRGHIGKSPEAKTINERRCLNFSMATNDGYRDSAGTWVDQTHWHRIVAWGPVAEKAESFTDKGTEVVVEGRIVTRQYKDKEGNTRYTTEIVANAVKQPEEKPLAAEN